MTRKTFFKTILGAVGSVGIFGWLIPLKPKELELAGNAETEPKIRETDPKMSQEDILKAYRKGVELSRGDGPQTFYQIHTTKDGKVTVLGRYHKGIWQSRASV